jgi:hypothetical protein
MMCFRSTIGAVAVSLFIFPGSSPCAGWAGGDTFETIQSDYDLSADDIRACIAFASHEVSQHRYIPLFA